MIGDICRAISKQILPHCDELMYLLLEDLANESVHRSVKPHILSVFGDIALAVGTDFTKYLDVILKTLQQASQANVDKVCARVCMDRLTRVRFFTLCHVHSTSRAFTCTSIHVR